MSPELTTLFINALATPVIVLVTMWVKNSFNQETIRQKREDGFIDGINKRILDLEREIKEVRVELKNRDADYVKLFQENASLKAKYEVLKADYNTLILDHEHLKTEYEKTVAELKRLGNTPI